MKRRFVLLLAYLAVSSCVTKKKFESTVSQYEAQDSVQNTLITQLQDSIVSIQEDSVFVERTVVKADTHEIRLSLKLLCDSVLMAKNAEIVNLKSKSVAVTVQDGTIVVKGFTQEQVNERVFESKKELNQTFSGIIPDNTFAVHTGQEAVSSLYAPGSRIFMKMILKNINKCLDDF